MTTRMSGLFFIAMAACVIYAGQAEANNALTVYIECKNPKKPELAVFKGTGVVISPAGHVLTAEHVMPDGYECEGSLENNTLAKRQLQVDFKDFQLSDKIDGKLLRFIASSGETFEYATYCAAQAKNVGDVIVVKGFHGKSRGLPSATMGILSTYIPNQRGILETDANTVGGKSGGPVFLQNTNTIIGIVAGAEFDPSGLPAYYGVLTAEALSQFGVLHESESCGKPEAAAGQSAAITEELAPTATSTDDVELENTASVPPELSVTTTASQPQNAASIEAEMGMSKTERRQVQESLTALGFDTHGVDGVWGSNTRKAIAGWQASIGKEVVGFIDPPQKELILTMAARIVVKEPAAEASSSAAPSGEQLYKDAWIHIEKDELRKALSMLHEATQLEPENAKFLAERGYVYYLLDQYQNSIADLNKSIALDPSIDFAWNDRGWTLLELGQIDRAFSDFKKALQLNPDNSNAAEGLEVLCDELQKC